MKEFLEGLAQNLSSTVFGFWFLVAVVLLIGGITLWQLYKTRDALANYFKSLVSSGTKDDLMHFINLVGSLTYIFVGAFVSMWSIVKQAPIPDGIVTLIIVNAGIFTSGGTAKNWIENKYGAKKNVEGDTPATPGT